MEGHLAGLQASALLITKCSFNLKTPLLLKWIELLFPSLLKGLEGVLAGALMPLTAAYGSFSAETLDE